MELISRTELTELFGCHPNTIKWNFIQFIAPKKPKDREVYYFAEPIKKHLDIPDFSEKFIKLKEASEILGCSRHALVKLCEELKVLRYYRLSYSLRGYDLYFLTSQLKQWSHEILQNRDINRVIIERWRAPANLSSIIGPLLSLTCLGKRDSEIAKLSIGEHKGDLEVSQIFEVTSERVRQVRAKALSELEIAAAQVSIIHDQLAQLSQKYRQLLSDYNELQDKLKDQTEARLHSLDELAKVPFSKFMAKCSIRAQHGLQELNLQTLADLAAYSRQDLMALRNCGRKTIDEIIDLALSYGLVINEYQAAS